MLAGPEAERLLVLSLMWDTPADADEFADAYKRFAKADSGNEAIVLGPDLWVWNSDNAVLLSRDGPSATLMVIGDDDALVTKTRTALLDAIRKP